MKKFTLVELMITVAVISVIVSILTPSLNSSFSTAKKVDCISNLKQISFGFNLYRKDNNKYPMPTWFLDDFTPVFKYINSVEVFNCKGDNEILVDDLSQLNGETAYLRNMDLTDMEDWELAGSNKNGGGGNNPYGLDPSNPNFERWISGKLKTEGVHDKNISNHGSYNFIAISEGNYQPVYSSDFLWEMKENRTLEKN